MFNIIKHLSNYIDACLPDFISHKSIFSNNSVSVTDHNTIYKYTNDPSFPFLVSFPRTGSHWLRMLMELYFGRPSLTLIFFYPNRRNYLTIHTHDMPGSGKPDKIGEHVERQNVIYLYRDPIDTIYSQMCYYHENLDNQSSIFHWTTEYIHHLDKWLHIEAFSQHKTILRYEELQCNLTKEFALVTSHFNQDLDHVRLQNASSHVSKQEVKKRTTYDDNVIQTNQNYNDNRQYFREHFSRKIWKTIYKACPYLLDDFQYLPVHKKPIL